MAVKIFTIANFSQGSTWTVGTVPAGEPDEFEKYLVSGPSISTLPKSFSFAGIPTGSTINSAVLTATTSTTAYKLRQVDGAFFSTSRNVISKVTPGASVNFEFKFQGSGSTSSAGTITSYLAWSNIKITVNYTEPASGLTLNKTICKAGDAIRATIAPVTTSATHKIKFSMTGVTTVTSATIPAGTKTYDYTIPLSWQNAMPNNATRTVTVTLETYSGATMTGDVDKTFTLALSDDAYPTITTFTITRIPGFSDEAIPGYVQGFSRAQIESAATGAYGATISQYKVTVGAWSNTGTDVTTPVFAESGTKTVVLEATDSRGRKSADTKTFAVIPYSLPALNNPIVHRSNDIGAAAYLGTYLYIKTGFSISPLGGTPDVNAATLSARIYQKGTTPPAWGDAGDVTITAGADNTISGLSISYSYSVDIRIVDKLGAYMYSLVIPSSSVAFSLKAGGLGAAFGKFAELDDALEIAWSKGWLGGNPIATYRVGSVFVTFESESPATLFPGTTWQKLGAGQFLVSAGTGYTAGNTGGEATHTLTAAETPKLSVTTYDGSEYVRMAASRQLGATGGTYAVPFAGTWSSSILKTDGGGGAHNNMPPWIAVNIWRRTA